MSMLWIWVVVAIVAAFIEIVTPTALISIWFSCGALVTAITSLFGIPIYMQVICFIATSIISMLAIRPVATRYLRGNIVATNADRFIGEVTVVTKRMTKEDWGEVKIGGQEWHAIPVDDEMIDVQEKVKVVAIEGAKLLVRRIENYQKEGK